MKLLIFLLAVTFVVSARHAEKQKQRSQQNVQQEQQQRLRNIKGISSSSSSSESSSSSSSSESSSESQEQRQKHNRQVQRQQQKMKHQPQTVLEQAVDKALEKLRIQNLRRTPQQQQQQQQDEYLQALQSVAMMNLFNNTQIKKQPHNQMPMSRASVNFFDPIFFQKRAVRKWIMRGFVDTYTQFSPPSANELADAVRTFNSLKLGDYTTNGKSGVLISQPITNLKKIVDLWVADGIVGANDAAELKLSMDGDEGQKYVKENSNRQDERTLVFSVSGFISLRLSDDEKEPMGTLIYALQKFKFQTALEITYESTKKCVIWGLFCETKVVAKPRQVPISAKESEDVWNYIKHDTLKNFITDNQRYLKYLDDEAVKYERFLPDIFRSDYKKMADNPTTPPDQLIPHDAFDPKSYNL